MNYHPVHGGVAIRLSMLHAKETGINSCRLDLWLVSAFTFFTWLASYHGKVQCLRNAVVVN